MYYAALIDGEGWVALQPRKRYKDEAWTGKMQITPIIAIAMAHQETIKSILSYFDIGTITEVKPQQDHHLPQWKWRVSHKKAYEIAKRVVHYSITKKKILQEIIDFYEKPENRTIVYDEDIKKKNELKKQLTIKRFCNESNCNEIHYGRGYCRKHYRKYCTTQKEIKNNRIRVRENHKKLRKKVLDDRLIRYCRMCNNELPNNLRNDAVYCSKFCGKKFWGLKNHPDRKREVQ